MANQRQAKRQFAIRASRQRRELLKKDRSPRRLNLESLEDRRVMATGPTLAALIPNSGVFLNPEDTLTVAPRELTFRFGEGQSIDPATIGEGIVLTRSGGDDVFSPPGTFGGNDERIVPGFIGLGDTPREVIMRFAANLPDDKYRVELVGAGFTPLRDTAGNAFNSGINQQIDFNLDLGTKVTAVVPQPITRDPVSRVLSQNARSIEVYFDQNELNTIEVQKPGYYRLINTATGGHTLPQTVVYDGGQRKATLNFASDIAAGSFKLEVGGTYEPDDRATSARHVSNSMQAPIHAFIGDSLSLAGDQQDRDIDLYRFDVRAGVPMTVTVTPATGSPADLDAVIRIFQVGAGGQLEEVGAPDNEAGAGASETVTTAALTPGIHYVGVSASGNAYVLADGSATDGNSTGSYSIQVTFADAPQGFDDTGGNNNSSFQGATRLGILGLAGQAIAGAILPDQANLYNIQFPGAGDAPGERDIPFQQHIETLIGQLPDGNTGSSGPIGVNGLVGVETITYDFQRTYGFNPQGTPFSNAISENQKQRVREVLELYSRYLGVQFREVADISGTISTNWTIATGDPRAVAPTMPTGVGGSGIGGVNGIAGAPNIPQNANQAIAATLPRGIAVMNALTNWGDSEYGGAFFRTAMHEIGHLLGLGDNFEAPALTIMGGEETPAQATNVGEPVFPGDPDIVYGQAVHRPESKDIDLYQFRLTEAGLFRAETIAERAATPSLLNTVLTLYKETATGVTTQQIIARNDDYYSSDSYLELRLDAGVYYVAVSSVGNTEFNPVIADSGFGGRTQGSYNLRMEFKPDGGTSLTDGSGVRFDGDADGIPGGQYDFWFQSGPTIFVDKANDTTPGTDGDGTLAEPYDNLQSALAAAASGPAKIVRIVGNDTDGLDRDINGLDSFADNLPYLIGFKDQDIILDEPLADGSQFLVPQNVTVMIDAGAMFKLRKANLNAGTTPEGQISRSGGAIQVLGVPGLSVRFTSYNDDTMGGDSDGPSAGPQGGDWGGIVFRNDSDLEATGVFLNYVNHAFMTYGGGRVFVDSVEEIYTPIHMVTARPSVSYNTIQRSSDAAMSADPNSFDDDGTRPSVAFDNRRIGPDIHDNAVGFLDATKNNSVGGLFVRVRTQAGTPLDLAELTTRWDDVDIIHVVSENLHIAGTPGGSRSAGADRPITTVTDGRLRIDAGMIVKLAGARIEATVGSQFIAEGNFDAPIIFTSLEDDKYGQGGTFDTNRDAAATTPHIGQWGGLAFEAASSASLDQVRVFYGGGEVPIEGGFDRFNAVEVHQADVRIANSLFQFNDIGGPLDPANPSNRNGRGTNADATIFVRGAQPIIINNIIRDNAGPMVSINANAMQDTVQGDWGRSTGAISLAGQFSGNHGPLVRGNRMVNNHINGMEVRSGTLTTETVWDDTDIAHIVRGEIVVLNHQVFSGLRLQSSTSESLVIKLQGANAGFTANGVPLDIDDRIGGTLHVIGQPGSPVVLTALADDTVPAGFQPNGQPMFDTDNGGSPAVLEGEINRANLIDNDIVTNGVGHFEATPAAAGAIIAGGAAPASGVTVQGKSLIYRNLEFINRYLNIVDVGSDGLAIDLSVNGNGNTITQQPLLFGDDLVVSQGTFLGQNNNPITWRVETRFNDGVGTIFNTITFNSALPLGNLQFINYFDQGNVLQPADDLLRETGTPGQADFRLQTFDGAERIGFSQGGVYTAGPGLENAAYTGWAADKFNDLFLNVGPGGPGLPFPITGNIDTVDLPQITDPTLGNVRGPADVTTALAWNVSPFANTATITTFLELIPRNPANTATVGTAGDWRGIRLDRLSNDRNVAEVLDREPAQIGNNDNNRTPQTAQFLGGLAPNEKSGDDNRRLGFELDGTIAYDRPNDVDVYSFTADSGTEVWIDLDRTSYGLDAMIELVDASGAMIARATTTDSTAPLAPPADPGLSGTALTFNKDPYNGRDTFTTNPFDPIMRVILPGNNLKGVPYFVRVRSQPLNFNGETATNLNPGLTTGHYQLQVRLRQQDEKPGSTVKFADVRYAVNGIEIHGLPVHSPLAGETAEADNAANDLSTGSQFIGNLLQTDRNTLTVGGQLSNNLDVDWYQFDLNFDLLQVINNYTNSIKTWSTIFDIDYGDGLSRADTTISVFDQNGQLILISRDSDVEDDQGTTTSDLADGSLGKLDPFLGPAQLPTGNLRGGRRSYFVAVSSNRNIPSVLDQTFNPGSSNTQVRLEPIDSVARAVTDHMEAFCIFQPLCTGGETAEFSENVFIDPATPLSGPYRSTLIDTTTVQSLQANVKPFTLADVPLFVSGGDTLYLVNAATGLPEVIYTTNPGLSSGNGFTQDMAFRSDGVLFIYEGGLGNTANAAGRFSVVDTRDGTSNVIALDGIPDVPNNAQPPISAEQITTNLAEGAAMAIGGTVLNDIDNTLLFYAVPDPNAQVVAATAPCTGLNPGPDGIPGNRNPADTSGNTPGSADDVPADPDGPDDILGNADDLPAGRDADGADDIPDNTPGNTTVDDDPANCGQTAVFAPASRLYRANPADGVVGAGSDTVLNGPGRIRTPGAPSLTAYYGQNDYINAPVPASAATDFTIPDSPVVLTFRSILPGLTGNGVIVNFLTPQDLGAGIGPTVTAAPANPGLGTPPTVDITPNSNIAPVPATARSDFGTGYFSPPGSTPDPTESAIDLVASSAGAAGNNLRIEFTASDDLFQFGIPFVDTSTTLTNGIIRVTLDNDASNGGQFATTIGQLSDALTNAQPQVVFSTPLGDAYNSSNPASVIGDNVGNPPFAPILFSGGSDGGGGSTVQQVIDAVNNNAQAAAIVVASGSGNLQLGIGTINDTLEPDAFPSQLILDGGRNSVGLTTGMAFGGLNNRTLYGVTTEGVFLIGINTSDSPTTGPLGIVQPAAPSLSTQILLPDALDPSIQTPAHFTALTRGPQNLENGRFANLFFAIADDNPTTTTSFEPTRLVALDVNGNLVPVFDVDGDGVLESTMNLGLAGATGLAFSPFDFNLWHPSFQRQGDGGHNVGPAGTGNTGGDFHQDFPSTGRGNSGANMSFYFGYEPIAPNPGPGYRTSTYEAYVDLGLADNSRTGNAALLNHAGQLGELSATRKDELSNTATQGVNPAGTFINGTRGTYNLPGGAKGALITDPFSLSSISKSDKPTFYFDYFLETEDRNSSILNFQMMRDSARVYIGVPQPNGSVNWELLATNNSVADAPGTGNAANCPPVTNISVNPNGTGCASWEGEIPTFQSVSVTSMPQNPRQHIQLLHDNTGVWRQARVDLSRYAGQTDLRLRFDFNSSADNQEGLFEDFFGDSAHAERGQDNFREGFFVDNIMVGLAERGELVINAPQQTTDFADLYTLVPGTAPRSYDPADPLPSEVLTGPYQLEIRRGTEYGLHGGGGRSTMNPTILLDTNERLIPDKRPDAPIPVEDFEPQLDSRFTWSDVGSDAPWALVDLGVNAGATPGGGDLGGATFGVESGLIADGQASRLQTTVTTAGGPISFSFAVSSELDSDFLRFYVDGSMRGEWSGEIPFTEVSFLLSAGTHSLTWSYEKDVNSVSAGLDKAFIDNIVLPISAPNPLPQTIDFEPFDAALPWATNDDAPWIVTDLTAPGGTTFGAASGPIGNGQRSGLNVSLLTGAGNLTFDLIVSSQAFGDFLRLYIDGRLADLNSDPRFYQRAEWSGDVGLTTVTIPIEAGRHNFRWSFEKNATDPANPTFLDQAFIDNVNFPTPQIGVQDIYLDPSLHNPTSPFVRHPPLPPTVPPSVGVIQSHTIDALYPGFGRVGDESLHREQGHIQIEQNLIYAASNIGIWVDADIRDPAGNPYASVRNLPTLNNDRLLPGVTIVNNIVANYGAVGIRFNGVTNVDPNTQQLLAPGGVPFGLIINNTIFGDNRLLGGSATTGVGIQVINNGGPTILNNIIGNAQTGIQVGDPNLASDVSAANTVIGANLFADNAANGPLGTNSITLAPGNPLFVDPATLNFYLRAGSLAIDSALNTLAERPSIVAVKSAVGIPQSPEIAPDRDRFNQLRVDDPNQNPPPGLGQNIFKDRGAVEKADFSRPTAQVIDPLDNDGAGRDRNPALGDIVIRNEVLTQFIIKFPDVGIGIDDATVKTENFVLTRSDNPTQPLVVGVDYVFVYNSTTDEVSLRAASGQWPQNFTYTIKINNTPIGAVDPFGNPLPSGVRDLAGNPLAANRPTGETLFTIFVGNIRDFGDAPDPPYQSTLNRGGAAHDVVPGFELCRIVSPATTCHTITEEQDSIQTATGDAGDDGVSFFGLAPGFTSQIEVYASAPGRLHVWFDLNKDGNWLGQDELMIDNRAIGAGTNKIDFTFGQLGNPAIGTTFARVRFTSNGLGADGNPLGPTGVALNGEVEDYQVAIGESPFQNPRDPLDVNNDGFVAPIDALIVMNYLNRYQAMVGGGNVPLPPTSPPFPDPPPFLDPSGGGVPGQGRYIDVTGDGILSSLDSLRVINELNNPTGSPEGESQAVMLFAEGESADLGTGIPSVLLASSSIVLDVADRQPPRSALASDQVRAHQDDALELDLLAAAQAHHAARSSTAVDPGDYSDPNSSPGEPSWDDLLSALASDDTRRRGS